jgi:hypothetical protein
MRATAAVIAALMLALNATACKGQQRLTYFMFPRSSEVAGDGYAYRTEVSFYPDGLVRSRRYISRATGQDKVLFSVDVKREGDVVLREEKDDKGNVTLMRFRIGKDTVAVEISPPTREGEVLEIVRREDKEPRTLTYRYNGNLVYEFSFYPDRTVLQDMRGVTLSYSADRGSRLPRIEAGGKDTLSKYEMGRTKSGQVFLRYKYADEPTAASYRVEGTPLSCEPLIAVLNFLMRPDTNFFAYLGAMPRK